VGEVEALLDTIILATIKPWTQAKVKTIVSLPENFQATIDSPEIQLLALELAVVTRGRGFIITEKGSKKVIGVGFTDQEIADIYFNWLEAVEKYEKAKR
jgi:hypothetical protein